MAQLSQLKIPGPKGGDSTPPVGIPDTLKGGLDTSGAGLAGVVVSYLFLVGVVLAVVFILHSGISYITSGGETAKMAAAKRGLTFSVVGLVVIVSAFFIVRFVIASLGGDPAKFFSF